MAVIAFLPGDGVGPEVAASARRVLDVAAKKFSLNLDYRDCFFGGAAIDAGGNQSGVPRGGCDFSRRHRWAEMG